MITDVELSDLYKTSHNRLTRALTRMGCPSIMAEDIAQDAWARAWQFRDQFRGDCSLWTWVNVVARSLLLQVFRRAKLEQVYNGLAPLEFEGAAFGRESTLEEDFTVNEILSKLRDADAAILVDYYAEGMSYKELSAKYSMSVSGVKTRRHRARLMARALA